MTEYNDTNALLLLNAIDGLGLKRKLRLLELVQSPSELIENLADNKGDIIKIAGSEFYDKILLAKAAKLYEAEREKLQIAGVTAISYIDESYPEQLLDIYEKPLILYCKGNVDLLKSRCISVVGTRAASRYGINVTRDFVAAFCHAGLTVVSGFARGIDSAAHKTCVELETPTIAVVASGLDICYPAENRSLMDKILSTNGLFVSEYRLGTYPAQYNFHERNRIISGLSEGVFVPEMKLKSGTMITVNHAIEQGKEVYVVPGNINSPTSEGSNRLIRDMQKSIVLEPADVLKDFGIYPEKEDKTPRQTSLSEQQILNALEKGETHFEELIEITGLTVGELQNVLFDLEMDDIIEKTTGNFYILK